MIVIIVTIVIIIPLAVVIFFTMGGSIHVTVQQALRV
jgi:hypothetical protein